MSHTRITILVTGWWFSVLAICNLAIAKTEPVSVEDLMKIQNVVEAQISPDGNRVAYVLAKYDPERDRFCFSLTSCSLRGTPQTLTMGPADFCPRWSPDSQTIAFLSDINGRDQICSISADGGDVECVTYVRGPIENFDWSPDGKLLAFLAPSDALKIPVADGDVVLASETKPGNQLFLVNTTTRITWQLTSGKGHITGFSWSPDGTQIVYSAQPTVEKNDIVRQNLYIADAKTGVVRTLVTHPGNNTMPEWSPDGKWIAFQSTCGPSTVFGKTSICVVTPDGRPAKFPERKQGVFEADEIEAMDWTADSKGLFLSFVAGLESHVDCMDLATGIRNRITTQPGVYTGFSFSNDRSRMAFLMDTPHRPKDVYVSESNSFAPQQLTNLNTFLEQRALGKMERIRWEAPDGLPIEGVLVKPVGFDPQQRYPLVTYLHGGPADVFRLAFGPYCLSAQQMEFFPVHVLAGKGYAVFCPNPRGSRGRGEKFREMTHLDWANGPLNDVLSGIDFLVEQGVADPNRLAIGGWCYGGYLAAWAVGRTGRFRAAAAGACISNLTSHFGLGDIPAINFDYFGGTPWEQPNIYWNQSPLKHVSQINTPLLLHHGQKDERVPLSQGREMYRALTYCGVPTELLIYKNQGHSLGRPSMLKSCIERNLSWIDKWLTQPFVMGDSKPQ